MIDKGAIESFSGSLIETALARRSTEMMARTCDDSNQTLPLVNTEEAISFRAKRQQSGRERLYASFKKRLSVCAEQPTQRESIEEEEEEEEDFSCAQKPVMSSMILSKAQFQVPSPRPLSPPSPVSASGDCNERLARGGGGVLRNNSSFLGRQSCRSMSQVETLVDLISAQEGGGKSGLKELLVLTRREAQKANSEELLARARQTIDN
jgi:hypothetical protein